MEQLFWGRRRGRKRRWGELFWMSQKEEFPMKLFNLLHYFPFPSIVFTINQALCNVPLTCLVLLPASSKTVPEGKCPAHLSFTYIGASPTISCSSGPTASACSAEMISKKDPVQQGEGAGLYLLPPCIYGYILSLQLPLMWQWWKETCEATICSLLACRELTWLFTQWLLWTTETLCPFGKWEVSTLGVSSLKQAIKYSLKFTHLGGVRQEAMTNIAALTQCSFVPWISHTLLCYEVRKVLRTFHF